MNNNFAENLRKIRKENNLSQEDLAEKLGVSRQAISKWESASAYPEMDKIIALCDLFNLNIDDLLHKDIKEIKGEENAKKNLNRYIDDFLKFITDTVNLFSNMTFKSKIKCLLEEFIIGLVLCFIVGIIYCFSNYIFISLFNFLPYQIYTFIVSLLNALVLIFFIVVAIIIFIHIFKTRYLDYYDREVVEKEEVITKEIPAKEIENKNEVKYEDKHKIIIRDPKHSEYKFINGLFKCIIYFIKFFSICIAFGLCLTLIMLLATLGFTFLLYKTGLFFTSLLGLIISSGVINIILILVLLNFIFNRQSDKKKLIWSFIISLITFGLSCGLLGVSILDFNVVKNFDGMLKSEKLEFKMTDNLFFESFVADDNITYIEKDIDNIIVDSSVYKIYDVEYYESNDIIHLYSSIGNPMVVIRDFIDKLNNKEILDINSDIQKVTIYANKENIQKLQDNENKYYQKQKDRNDEISYYENVIDSYENRIYELEDELSNCKYN